MRSTPLGSCAWNAPNRRPSGKAVASLVGDLHGERRLAQAAGPGDGDQRAVLPRVGALHDGGDHLLQARRLGR
ncbi:hypothetical protein GCM10025868_22770 [Angustibacter aerolatus]|uniref:Uncharacterized protein n=1 Tax=Angustibacter aerolatus TaxID=1162965 RepID=A0ABQ6JFQ2_9ACTN|nr:hypothetical protein GCM10025868_22770 [Angustibacter aerolatus]